jgi:hypothetical protein
MNKTTTMQDVAINPLLESEAQQQAVDTNGTNSEGVDDAGRSKSVHDIIENQQEVPAVPTFPIETRTIPVETRTRSGKIVKAPAHVKDYVSFESSIKDDASCDFTEGIDPITLLMTTSQDTLYFHEILRNRIR